MEYHFGSLNRTQPCNNFPENPNINGKQTTDKKVIASEFNTFSQISTGANTALFNVKCLVASSSKLVYSKRGQHYVPRFLCSPVPMFPEPIFPGTYVPRYLCSPVPMFPDFCTLMVD